MVINLTHSVGGQVVVQRTRARRQVCTRAASQQTPVLDKPAWTGDSWPSKVANWIISTPALFNVLKVAARGEIKNSAVKRGVRWDENLGSLQAALPELEAIKTELEDKSIQYPSYYLVPFHAYDTGNLSWQAAFEVEPASEVMAIRTFKTETQLDPEAASTKLRTGLTDRLKEYMSRHNLRPLGAGSRILDIGCSVGVSTRWLARVFPEADVSGMDLSPYFLAVAEYRERQKSAGQKRIPYVHGLAEDTKLPDACLDLASYQFVIHECPENVIKDFLREAARIVKPGGVVMMADNNPRSATIQNLPPFIAAMMKSTEPHSDSYYATDVEACMQEAGFTQVVTMEGDHRHRVVLGIRG